MQTQQSDSSTFSPVEAAKMSAYVVPAGDNKYACIVDKEVIGKSKHADYFEYHYRRKDLRALADRPIAQFVHLDAEGKIESIVKTSKPDAARLKSRQEFMAKIQRGARQSMKAYNKAVIKNSPDASNDEAASPESQQTVH